VIKQAMTSGPLRLVAVLLTVLAVSGAGQCSVGGREFGGNTAGSNQVTSAPISTFGSIFAVGTEFSTSTATVSLDGAAVSESQFRPGQIVGITSTISSDRLTGAATAATVADKLIGPVTATDPGSGTFTVLGQTVHVDGDTSVGPGFTVPDVAGFTVGTVLVVDGYRTSDGVLASRIDLTIGTPALRVAGRVANLSGFAQTFTLNGTTIDYSNVSGGLPSQVTNGSYVIASGGTAGTATLHATVVSAATELAVGENGDRGVVHGTVTRFGSAGDFDVTGQPVGTGSGTTFTNGASTDVALDREVEITGSYNSGGVLVATGVDFAPLPTFRIVGPVQSINATGSTFAIAGVTLTTSLRTRWDDQSSLGLKVFGIANLAIGDWVEVRGVSGGSLSGTARVVERRAAPSPAYVELQDVPTALSNPDITLTGIDVNAQTATFTDASGQGLTRTNFFAQASGQVVRVRGAFVANTLTAATVTLRP
jgi:hypothetical protein